MEYNIIKLASDGQGYTIIIIIVTEKFVKSCQNQEKLVIKYRLEFKFKIHSVQVLQLQQSTL